MSFEALQGNYSMDPVSTGPVPTLINNQEQLQAVPENLRHTALASYEGALMVLSATGQVLDAHEQASTQEVAVLRDREATRHAEAKHKAEQKLALATDAVNQKYDARASAADARLQEQVAEADAWAAREFKRIRAERDSRVSVATTVHEGDIRAADTEQAMTMRAVSGKYEELTAANELQHQGAEQPIDERAAVDAVYFQLCKNTIGVLSSEVFQTQEELTSAARLLQSIQHEIGRQEQRLTRLSLEVEGLAHDTQEAKAQRQASQKEFDRLKQENGHAQQTSGRLLEEKPGLQATDINLILGEHERSEQEVQASWRGLVNTSSAISEASERIIANRAAYEKLRAEYKAVLAWLNGPDGDNTGARGYALALESQVGGSVQVLRWLADKLDNFQDLVRNDATSSDGGTRRHMIQEIRDLLGEDLFAQVRVYHKQNSTDELASPDAAAAVDPEAYRSSAKAGWFTPSADIRYQEA